MPLPTKAEKPLSTSGFTQEVIKALVDDKLWKNFHKLHYNVKHLQEFKEFKEYITQKIATLEQNQAELLEMKSTMEQIKI